MENISDLKIEVVTAHKCLLGESPIWDVKSELIYWIDILKGEIHEYSPKKKSHRLIPVHQIIGSIGLCINGNFIAATKSGFAFINRINGEVKMISDPETHLTDNRFNEGKCDPEGRFLAGTMSLSGKQKAGSLYALEKDLSIAKKIEGISVSNGMAWSKGHETFYYIDTPTCEVASYDYDKSTGNISNKKVVIKIPTEEGFPDGMTIDNEGMLWIAHWNGGQITRWDPQTGEKVLAIKFPVKNVTSCIFGGENLRDLYITSASARLTEKEIKMQPLAGSLFVIKNSRFAGIEAFEFNG